MLVAAAFPASAVAAPDKSAELSADTPTFAWEGEGTGIPIDALHVFDDVMGSDSPFACDSPGHDCDYILLDVKHPGSVKITVGADDAMQNEIPEYGNLTVPDLDVYFYASDKDGVPQGESLTGIECAGGNAVETCEAKALKAGLYVVEVSFFLADAATYKGQVALTTAVPPTPAAPAVEAPAPPPAPPAEPPAPAAPQQPAPPAQPYIADEPKPAAKKPSKRATCQKKAKKIKNKAKRKRALKRCR